MNTKSKVTLSIIIFLVVAIGAGLYIRHSFSEKHSDTVESSFSNLSVKNNTTKEFKSVGIAWDDNALMQKQTTIIPSMSLATAVSLEYQTK